MKNYLISPSKLLSKASVRIASSGFLVRRLTITVMTSENTIQITPIRGEVATPSLSYMVSAAHVVNFTKPKISVRRRVLDRYLNEVDVYYDANIVALDSENDIAILKINVKGEIPHLYLPEEGSSDLDLSSRIAILGYPFGVSRFDNVSITEGKIASYQNVGLKRVINLACEAKVGNSGSCVIDLSSGLCIGVLIGAHLKDREEINYCAPIDYVWKLVRKYQA